MKQESISHFSKIYTYFFLDHIVEAATRLSGMHAERSQRFTNLNDDTLEIFRRLQHDCGKGCGWPDSTERGEIFDLALGPPFVAASSALRRAVLAMMNCEIQSAAAAHHAAVDDAAYDIRDMLGSRDAGDVQSLSTRLEPIFAASVKILSSPSVRKTFGEFSAPAKDWPMTERASPSDVTFLDLVFEAQQRSTCHATNQYYFGLIQRVGVLGGKSIDAVLRHSGDDNSRQEICTTAYRWERALSDLVPVQAVVRSWREPEFRLRLTPQEQFAMPAHPSGDVDTQNAGLRRFTGPASQAGGQTFTVNNEICCSTTPSVSCLSHCPPPGDDPIIVAPPSTYPCCTHHC